MFQNRSGSRKLERGVLGSWRAERAKILFGGHAPFLTHAYFN